MDDTRPTRSPIRSPQQLAASIARLRVERGLTQEELAYALDVPPRYIYQLESGQPTKYASRLFGLLRVLGAHLEIKAGDEA